MSGQQSMERAGTALVTGGARGIGRAVCVAIAPRHERVAIVYRGNEAAASEAAELVRAQGTAPLLIKADIADPAAAAAAVEEAAAAGGAGLDVLVHCAGAATTWKPVRDIAPAQWNDMIDVDLNGFFNVVSPALRIMHAAKRGAIVAVTSISARSASPRSAQSAAAKAGVEAMVRVIAREEGRYGIRANAVAAGLTNTDQGRDAMHHWGEEMTARVLAQAAIPRIGTAEEVAQVVAFLASPAASYVTGRVLAADGGQFISA
ncbi:MAG: SDR family oxidoreductase [Rhizobiaceae bacterium]|nr:SDR family oxidoreductase [Rhizobiaceae bacterium]